MSTSTKRCTCCGTEKTLTEFYKDRRMKDGLLIYCKSCHKKKVKLQQEKHYIRFRATGAAYQRTARGKLAQLRTSAKKRNILCNLTEEEFCPWYSSLPRTCIYCELPEEHVRSWCAGSFKQLQVDRLDNSKGYEMGNMALCCPRCNWIKGDLLSYEEMLLVGKLVLQPKVRAFLSVAGW